MNVKELINLLSEFDQDQLVYILDIDGTAQTAMHVVGLKHQHLLDGISIPDDVAIMTSNTFNQVELIAE